MKISSLIILVIICAGFGFGQTKLETLPEQFFNASKNLPALTGDWVYTAMIYADGSVHELSGRDSHIVFESNGNYTNYIYTDNPSGHAGTYSVAVNNLTLNDSVDKTTSILKMAFDGDDKLTLTSDTGLGLKLARK